MSARPAWAAPELVVVHCISLPENEFGTGAPLRLFQGVLDVQEHESFADLRGVRVSAHLFIDRQGGVSQCVAFDQQAWHAGVSAWCNRSGCNAFSIGIEVEGSVTRAYTDAQYTSLDRSLWALRNRYPAIGHNVVGHADIAPGRKTDPGPHFDWSRLCKAQHVSLAEN